MALAAARREEFGSGLPSLGEGEFSGEGDISVQFGIEALDAGEHELGEFDGRELTFAKKFSDFLDGGERQIGVVHAQNIFSGWRRFPKLAMFAMMNAMRN